MCYPLHTVLASRHLQALSGVASVAAFVDAADGSAVVVVVVVYHQSRHAQTLEHNLGHTP